MTSPAYYEHLTRWQLFQQGWQYIAVQESSLAGCWSNPGKGMPVEWRQ